MAASTSTTSYDIRACNRADFDRAKRWWAAGLGLKLTVVVVDVLFVFFSPTPWSAPLVVFLLGAVSEAVLLYFERLYGKAEALLRKLDARDLMGWDITPEELRDFIVDTPQKLRTTLQTAEEQYFASKESVGPKKTIEGVQESAWWSKHLAKTMAIICSLAAGLLVLSSLVTLLISINAVQGPDVLSNIAKIVASTLAVVFSLGLVNLIVSYYAFSTAADDIEKEAVSMRRAGVSDPVQAVKLMNDYHLARASAPPIPSWLWKRRGDDLNERWNNYHATM
jgi:hypothetical protein